MSEFQCVKCGGKLECFGGLSAHPDNWTCPKCDRAAMGNSKNPRCSITGNPCCTDTWNGYPDCHCGRILCKLAAREAELAAMKERAEKFRWQVIDTCKRAEAAERELESVKAENSKLRSALEIVHFKREPWQ